MVTHVLSKPLESHLPTAGATAQHELTDGTPVDLAAPVDYDTADHCAEGRAGWSAALEIPRLANALPA